eukprot:5707398-Amphidinium_carterae.1
MSHDLRSFHQTTQPDPVSAALEPDRASIRLSRKREDLPRERVRNTAHGSIKAAICQCSLLRSSFGKHTETVHVIMSAEIPPSGTQTGKSFDLNDFKEAGIYYPQKPFKTCGEQMKTLKLILDDQHLSSNLVELCPCSFPKQLICCKLLVFQL